ncbi:hypothetical protein F5X96DRAFT_653921 [Biscogniauxia mediterranea]|nr:hypothetical protein F5X96DRAFT_653921 [Biscogniauxia mediterranea]
MAPGTLSIVYPADTKFDMDYYLNKHMPLVQSLWQKYGLKGWKIAQYDEGAIYKVQAWLEFEDESGVAKAGAGPETKTLLADIPNYSDKDCIMLGGVITGGNF